MYIGIIGQEDTEENVREYVGEGGEADGKRGNSANMKNEWTVVSGQKRGHKTPNGRAPLSTHKNSSGSPYTTDNGEKLDNPRGGESPKNEQKNLMDPTHSKIKKPAHSQCTTRSGWT